MNISAIEIIGNMLIRGVIMSKEEEGMEFRAPQALHMEEGITTAHQDLIEQIILIIMMVYIGVIIIVVGEEERVLEGVVQHIRATTRRDNLIVATITLLPI